VDGHYQRADRYVAEFQQYAFDLQNSDGSWNPNFFAARGPGRDASGMLRSSGHILEWLVFCLPDSKLEDPRVVKSVGYVAGLLAEPYSRWNAAASTPREIDSVMHALHALRIYDRRVFKTYEPDEPDNGADSGTKTARLRSAPGTSRSSSNPAAPPRR
jgi:hypothetical protein